MKIVHDIRNSGINTDKKVYTCSSCGKLFNWNNNSYWYGSYNDLEMRPHKIKYYCNKKCI